MGSWSKNHFLDKCPKLSKKLAAATPEMINRSSSTICYALYRELPRSTFQTAGKSVASHIYESRVCCLWEFTLYRNFLHPNDLRTLQIVAQERRWRMFCKPPAPLLSPPWKRTFTGSPRSQERSRSEQPLARHLSCLKEEKKIIEF